MLPTAAVTVLALSASVVLMLAGQGAPAAVLHLALAVGVVPLIFAAIAHFVPVLTRTGRPPAWVAALPFPAQASGLLASAAMQGWLPRQSLYLAAGLDFVLAAALLAWVIGRARACLGAPHAGWRWYGAALAALCLALAALPLLLAAPAWTGVLRVWHIHLNTLGLVGLAALGTLPVLLPTALGQSDPAAAPWLRQRLPWAACAVLLIAPGWPPGAALGGGILIWLALDLLGRWLRRHGWARLWQEGAAASLAAAVAGFIVLFAAGIGHGFGWWPARPAIAAWFIGGLLPLVTGALSQLLPVWRWPGPATPARRAMGHALAAGGPWRGATFLAGALAWLCGWPLVGSALAAAGLLLFLAGAFKAMA